VNRGWRHVGTEGVCWQGVLVAIDVSVCWLAAYVNYVVISTSGAQLISFTSEGLAVRWRRAVSIYPRPLDVTRRWRVDICGMP